MTEQPDLRPQQDSSHSSTVGPSAAHSGPVSTPAPCIEDYLDQVSAPLTGRVPAARLVELRAEMRSHLEALVEAYQELGSGPEEAVGAALKQLGDPRRLGQEWRREWEQPARSRAGEVFLAAGVLGVSASYGAALLVALEHHLGHNAFELALGGPLLPLAAGFLVGLGQGKHRLGSRWGLLLIAAAGLGVSLLMTSADPRPPLVGAVKVFRTLTARKLRKTASGW